MKKNIFKSILIFLMILSILSPISLSDDLDDETIDVSSEINSLAKYSETNIKEPDINSRACVVIDRKSNTVLYGKNENTKKKMASTTKIMTATIVIENCNLNDTIEVSKKAAGTGGSKLGLKTGDKITILDLLYGLMLRSGNDAAVALAEYAGGDIPGFAKLMNSKASELGLVNTHFETPHGLDSDEHYTTAYELALLSNYALKNPTFAKIVGTKNYTITINGYPKALNNTNELLGNMDGIYGIKTGFTNGANRCLVTACKRNNMDIICVVLGADTKKFRTLDSIKLINYVLNNFEIVNLQNLVNNEFDTWKNKHLKSILVNKAIPYNLEVSLESLKNPEIPIRKNLITSLSFNVNYKNYFEAPLDINTTIGSLEIINNNNKIDDCRIYLTNKIDKKDCFYYLLYMIKNFSYIIQNNII